MNVGIDLPELIRLKHPNHVSKLNVLANSRD